MKTDNLNEINKFQYENLTGTEYQTIIDEQKKQISKLQMDLQHIKNEPDQHAKAFLKNITESLPQYVFWKDIKSVYLGCNKNYAEFVGLKAPEEIIGKTDADLKWLSTGDTAETFQQGDQHTMSGNPITNQEETLSLPNGNTLNTLVSKLPIYDNNKVIGIAGYFTDITELKQKEKELIKAKQDAEAANQAKSTFITNISHDIRTPLAGMIGMTKIILKEIQGKQGQEAATNLFRAENILLDLLNEVIEMSKLESGNLPICEIKFSLKEVINNLVVLVKPSVIEKQLNLIVNYDEKIPDYLIGDQMRVHRILLNLVSNAIKFTPKGNIEIIVHLAEKKDRKLILKMIIRDTGVGMSPDAKQIIFTRFTRLEPSYKGTYKGMGLGLSIVKQFISELDGEIYVDSVENKGSTFTCIIPLKCALLNKPENQTSLDVNLNTSHKLISDNFDRSEASVLSTAHQEQASLGTRAKLLLVEDNKIAQFAAKYLLEEIGCRVDTADTGNAAIQLFKENQYDLVFMDIGLPDKSGFEVTAEMQTLEKLKSYRTPIVALSAHLDQNNSNRCLEVGMKKVLIKPLTEKNSNDVLEELVDRSKISSVASNVTTSQNMKSIDLELGIKIVNGDKETAIDMLRMFVEMLTETLRDLELSYNEKEWDKFQFIIHQLHGSACYCGVPRLIVLMEKLQNNLDDKNTAQIVEGYENVITELNNIRVEFEKIR